MARIDRAAADHRFLGGDRILPVGAANLHEREVYRLRAGFHRAESEYLEPGDVSLEGHDLRDRDCAADRICDAGLFHPGRMAEESVALRGPDGGAGGDDAGTA